MKYKQESPFAVQIELAESCNLRCSFCGLNGIRTPKENNFKFMTKDTLASLVRQMVENEWNPRVEFAMHGEPTMNPDFVNMIAVVRDIAPSYHIMMTSNGGGLLRKPGPIELIKQMFDAGLNILALDDYQDANIVPKIRRALGDNPGEHVDATVFEYPDDKRGNPHARGHRGMRKLTFIRAIDIASNGTHSTLNNHAGAGAPPNDAGQGKRCSKPFRELSVRWDGSVAVCCNDWRGQYKCGNVVKDGLDAVWNGAAMHAARQKLILGQRDFAPCRGCDATSDRVGLLPDKFGKVKMPKPNVETETAIKRALAGKPYTAPVLRPWEK